MNDFYITIINEICMQENINAKWLSFDWILELQKGNKVRHIMDNCFDLNTDVSAKIANDKYACYEVLKANNVPVVEYHLVPNPLRKWNLPGSYGAWEDLFAFFENSNSRVVLKQLSGSKGDSVFLCSTKNELEYAASVIFEKESCLCISPYYDYEYEYRVFFVNGICRFAYGKRKPYIDGDGIHTIRELASINPHINAGKYYNKESVPLPQERVVVDWRHNLSKGAIAFEVADNKLIKRLFDLAQNAANCVNIRFATIDIIDYNNELYVMEINSRVSARIFTEQFSGKAGLIKEIYTEAIKAMFAD